MSMQILDKFIGNLNGVLFSDYTVYALLLVGLLFTVWSFFGQYRALTHGVSVVRGKYDDHNDPGAINHFQALSAALSATVGLGNIAGVALAVALGGPGAVLWMWLIGLLGMALKMTEVTQSMLFRNTDDPENPHGGPMFVVAKGLAQSTPLRLFAGVVFAVMTLALTYLASGVFETQLAWIPGILLALVFLALGLVGGKGLGLFIGGIFVVTLIISAITGGNMFQAWNVADITFTYFEVPQIATGVILTILVGLVIIGGIKRIGSVAGKIVPFMCATYVLAAVYVLIVNIGDVPSMLALIVRSGLPTWMGGTSPDATGAFLGGTFVYAAMWGVKRALFSSEAGQGSSPIAHSAAKTDEPVREGVVAGLEPFIDTIVVCTLTALVILSSGAYNRDAESTFPEDAAIEIVFASEAAAQLDGAPAASLSAGGLTVGGVSLPARIPTASEAEEAAKEGEATPGWQRGEAVFVYATLSDGTRVPVGGKVIGDNEAYRAAFDAIASPPDAEAFPEGVTVTSVEGTVYHGGKPAWKAKTPPLLRLTNEAQRIRGTPEGSAGWRSDELVFMVVSADTDKDTGRDFRRISGKVKRVLPDDGAPDEARSTWVVEWKHLESNLKPHLRVLEDGTRDTGIYGDYAGASMTAYAFDRVAPGLGKWLITIAAWLFALSTMISWSYYGEQGIYFFCGRLSARAAGSAALIYKVIYALLILATTALAMPIFGSGDNKFAIIATDHELDNWTTLGLGVMLVANVPIMIVFAPAAMKAFHNYFNRMSHGGDDAHDAPKFTDVVEGKDIE